MASDRLTGLAKVTGELAGARDRTTVTDIVTRHATAVSGASAALLALREGSTMRSLGHHGTLVGANLGRPTFSVDEDHPLCDAVTTGEPVILIGRDAVALRYPQLAGADERSIVVLPLAVHGAPPFGVLGFRFDGVGNRPDPTELQMLVAIGDACTQALKRIEAERRSEEQSRRLQFLSDASEALASSLDHRQTLATVAQLAVPDFADWCTVQILNDGRLDTLAVAHVDPEKASLAKGMQAKRANDPGAASGAAHVARTGVSELVEDITDEMLVLSARDEHELQMGRHLEIRCAIVVALKARERVLGVMTFVSSRPGRRYTQEEVIFAEDLARRAAMAIDNADLFSQTQHAAQELQRALLPQQLPTPAGWGLGALYRPSGRTDVGGDFYDVIVLADRRVAVVMGDVMGRGVDAAAASARMRSAIRAYVAENPDPTAVAAGVDRLMTLFDSMPLVTVVYMVFDPRQDGAELFVAGHLPPLVVRKDGTTAFISEAGWPAFGVGPVDRRGAHVVVHRGDTVLFYTDGLVERRDEDIDASLARLQAEAAQTPRGDLDAWLTALADTVSDSRRDDDIAALAVRRTC